MSVTYTTVQSNIGPLTHWERPRIEPTSSWMLVGFAKDWAMTETPRSHFFLMFFYFFHIGGLIYCYDFLWRSVLPKFSWRYMVSKFTFRSLVHFYFIFVHEVRKCSNCISLCVAFQFSSIISWRDSFVHFVYLYICIFVVDSWSLVHRIIAGSYSLLVTYVSLFVPVPCFLNYCSLSIA